MSCPQKDPRPTEAEVVWLDDTGAGREPLADRVLSIEGVARMFGVSQLALRYYEWRGLIARRQVQDGVRVYSWADCERVAFIAKCRKAGLPLHDIAKIVEATDDDTVAAVSQRGREICMLHIEALERQRRVLGDALAELNHLYALLGAKLDGDDAKPSANR